MAVNGEILVYPGQELTPQDFAIMMERISVIGSGIVKGCTVAFSETASNTINVGEGYVLVRGRLARIETGTLSTSSLSASAEKWYVYARVHLEEIEPADLFTVYITDTEQSDATATFNETNQGIAYATLAIIDVASGTVYQLPPTEIGESQSVILQAANWSDETVTTESMGSYTVPVYTINDSRFTDHMHIDLVPRAVGGDYGYLYALQAANIQEFSMANGELKLGCYGTLPTVDLEIGIIFRGAF